MNTIHTKITVAFQLVLWRGKNMIMVYDDSGFGVPADPKAYDDALQQLLDDEKKELVMHPERGDRKLSTESGTAQVYVSDNVVAISNDPNAIVVNEKGIIISGRTHITKTPSSVRIGGFWVFNEELLTTVPSTTYTPIPVLLYKEIPYAKQASTLNKLLA